MRYQAFKDLTRFEQTLFALPFIISSSCLSLTGTPISVRWIWILPAFLCARISGMAFNQLIDRHIDALNPRTQNRVLPTGRVTVKQARIVAWSAWLLFIVICLQMNDLTACLAPVVAILIYIYSYLKRVHSICHLVLGMIHFFAPVMVCTALTGSISLSACFLGAAACLSIVGNDVAYAIQDAAFDRKHNLFSLPSTLGVDTSLKISAVMHFFCLFMLICVGIAAHLFLFYYSLIPLAALMFIHFHRLLHKQKASLGKYGLARISHTFSGNSHTPSADLGSQLGEAVSAQHCPHPAVNQSQPTERRFASKKCEKYGLESAFFVCNVSISFSTLFFIGSNTLWTACHTYLGGS